MANAIDISVVMEPATDAEIHPESPRTVRFEEPQPHEGTRMAATSNDTANKYLTSESASVDFSSRTGSSSASSVDTSSGTSGDSGLAPPVDNVDCKTVSSTGTDTSSLPVLEPVPCLYKLGRELGVGTYSVVKETRHIDTNKWYAAKIINKRLMRGREHLVKNEIVVLKRVSKGHPNILTLVDYFETNESLYLVTELAKGGELFERIFSRGSFYESDAAQLMKQITSGVAHLHAHGIVHRDLKPENLLFKSTSSSSSLLICDFGLSRIIDEENFRMLTTTVGTPSYMAPEIFTKKGHGKPVDIWALGVIAYLLLSGFTPFDRDTPVEEREAIERGEFQFTPEKFWMHVTQDAQNFIRQCLQVDPSLRPTAEECLKSGFLTRKYRGRSDITPHMVDGLSVSSSGMRGIPSELEGMPMNGAYSTSPEPDTRKPIFSAKWG